MSYQPFDRNAAGIVFFGSSVSDQVYESTSTFTYDGTNKLSLPDGGYIGSQSQDDALQIASDGDLTTIADLTVGGNLIVNGTTTTVNSTTVTIDDPIFTLGGDTAPGSDDNKDRGIEFRYHNGSTAKLGFFGFDDSTGKFTFIPDATNSSEVFSGTAGTIVANLEGNVTGDVTGNASTATALETARNFSITGEVTASAVSFDGSDVVALAASLDATAITGQTEKSGAAASNDVLLIIDSEDSNALKKITRGNLISGLGGFSNFDVAADSGTAETIADGNTLTIAGGNGITTVVGATDTVTVTADLKANGGLVFESNEIAVDLGASAITGTLAIGDGGTGATTASAARTALGLAIGSDVQAYDAALAAIAGLATTDGGVIVGNGSTFVLETGATLRTSLGVDAAGTDNSTDVTLNAAVTDVLSLSTQEISAVDNGSDAIVGWDDTAGKLTYLSAADVRTAIGVDAAGTDNSTDVTLAGSLDYLTISGQEITVGAIVLSTDVSGQLPVGNGGTGASSASGARTNLGLVIGTDVQAYHANLAAIAGMTPSDGYFIVGNGSTFVLENGATARASLGVDAAGTDNSTDVTLVTSSHDYLSISGQAITLGTIDISDDTNLAVNGTLTLSGDTLSVANGGVDTTQLAAGAVTEAKRERTVATTSSTSTISNDITLATAGAGGITLTLPAAASGKVVIVKKVDTGAGNVTLDPPGAVTIDGAATKVLYHQYETMTCVSDGTNWFIV